MSDQRAQTWDMLGEVVDSITYVDRSRFALERDDEANYAILYVFIHAPNSYRDDRADRHTRHEFVVPVATYDRENWIRWVFEQVKSIEIHEVCEWFKVDGQRAYPPHHGNGEIPYVEWHLSAAERAALAPGEGLSELDIAQERGDAWRSLVKEDTLELERLRAAIDQIDQQTYGWCFASVSSVIDRIRLTARAALARPESGESGGGA